MAEDECNHNGTVYRIGDTFTRECSLCMCVHGNNINCSFNTCPPTELPVPSILCPFPHVRRDGCCDTVFCMEDNIGQWVASWIGSVCVIVDLPVSWLNVCFLGICLIVYLSVYQFVCLFISLYLSVSSSLPACLVNVMSFLLFLFGVFCPVSICMFLKI